VREPAAFWIVLGAVAVLAVLHGWRRAKRRAVRIEQFHGWPPPPMSIMPMGGELRGRGIALGLTLAAAIWTFIILPAWWLWGLL
jgi:hypothetical protein